MNYIKNIAESILRDDYNNFVNILRNNRFTPQELGHLLVYILPRVTLFPSDEEKYKSKLLEYNTDLIVFASKCRCAICQQHL